MYCLAVGAKINTQYDPRKFCVTSLIVKRTCFHISQTGVLKSKLCWNHKLVQPTFLLSITKQTHTPDLSPSSFYWARDLNPEPSLQGLRPCGQSSAVTPFNQTASCNFLPGFEAGTSRTWSENRTPRPTSQSWLSGPGLCCHARLFLQSVKASGIPTAPGLTLATAEIQASFGKRPSGGGKISDPPHCSPQHHIPLAPKSLIVLFLLSKQKPTFL